MVIKQTQFAMGHFPPQKLEIYSFPGEKSIVNCSHMTTGHCKWLVAKCPKCSHMTRRGNLDVRNRVVNTFGGGLSWLKWLLTTGCKLRTTWSAFRILSKSLVSPTHQSYLSYTSTPQLFSTSFVFSLSLFQFSFRKCPFNTWPSLLD